MVCEACRYLLRGLFHSTETPFWALCLGHKDMVPPLTEQSSRIQGNNITRHCWVLSRGWGWGTVFCEHFISKVILELDFIAGAEIKEGLTGVKLSNSRSSGRIGISGRQKNYSEELKTVCMLG